MTTTAVTKSSFRICSSFSSRNASSNVTEISKDLVTATSSCVGGGGHCEDSVANSGNNSAFVAITGTTTSTTASNNNRKKNEHLPVLRPELMFNDNGLFTVYCFVKDFIG